MPAVPLDYRQPKEPTPPKNYSDETIRADDNLRHTRGRADVLAQINIENYYRNTLGDQIKGDSGNRLQALCPFHDDRRASFSADKQSGAWICHAGCGSGSIFDFDARLRGGTWQGARNRLAERAGIKPARSARPPLLRPPNGGNSKPPPTSQTIKTYDYTDEGGTLLFQVCRMAPKDFRQRRPDGKGGWLWNTQGVRRTLYRLPEIVKAETVYVVEGEKDADALIQVGLAATTNSGGSGRWRPEYSDSLAGKHIVILPDNDDPGRKHAEAVARSLRGKAASVKVLHLYGLPPKGDITDWLLAGGTAEELSRLTMGAEEEEDWEKPIPFDAPLSLPDFPLEALPSPVRNFVEEVSKSRQVPVDLPAVLALGVVAAAGAGRYRVKIGDTHSEPLNIFAAVVLPPGSRKSDTFRDVILPIEEYELELAIEAAPRIANAKEMRAVEDGRLKNLRERAAKIDDAVERNNIAREAADLAANLTPVPCEPRLIAGDVTPERLANLLHEQGGRVAVMDAEAGGVFDIMAGRYTRDGSANFDVYLRGHAGDAIRVDRIGRATDFVRSPALTLVLTLQLDVLRSLADKPGFRGRGLLGRFLYAIPAGRIGTRMYKNRPISEVEKRKYSSTIRAILALPSPDPLDHESSYNLRIENESLAVWADYADEVERGQADGGDLEGIRDFASKLSGAAARIAGGIHLIEHANGTPWTVPISSESVTAGWAIADYFKAHALAAFSMMGSNPEVDRAQSILRWIERNGLGRFTLRCCYQTLRRTVAHPSELLPGLEVLEGRGFISRLPDPERPGRGRKPSPTWEVNPRKRTQNSHNSLGEGRAGNSVNSVNSVYALRGGELA